MSCTAVVCAEALVDAAWAALTSGRPRDLRVLEELLGRQVATGPAATDGLELQASLQRLEMLLAATARNLRILRGQCGMGRQG